MRHGEEQRSRTGPDTDEWWASGDCWPVYSTYYNDMYDPRVPHGELVGLKKHHLFRPYRTGHSMEYYYDKDMTCNNCGKSYGHVRKARRLEAKKKKAKVAAEAKT